MSENSFKL